MEDEEQTTNETNGADISEEQVIEQQIIPFMGDDLAAALAPGGNIYITLPGICTALGLNTRGQLQRIQRTRTLSKGLRRIPIKTKGGFQQLNCLRIDLVALWLACNLQALEARFGRRLKHTRTNSPQWLRKSLCG